MRTKEQIEERRKYLEQCIIDAQKNDALGWYRTHEIISDCESRLDELDWIEGVI